MLFAISVAVPNIPTIVQLVESRKESHCMVFMYVCVHIYICIYIYIHINTRIDKCIYIYIYLWEKEQIICIYRYIERVGSGHCELS